MSTEFGETFNISTKMPRKELEERIKELLSRVTMCVLSTSKDDVPHGTPLETFTDGFTFYMMPDPGKKIVNLKANPNVSISIFESNFIPKWETEWKTAWGLQITGKGQLIEYGQPGWDIGRKAMKVDSFLRALGKEQEADSLQNTILKVVPSEIRLTEWGLPARGYARQQVWQPEGATETGE